MCGLVAFAEKPHVVRTAALRKRHSGADERLEGGIGMKRAALPLMVTLLTVVAAAPAHAGLATNVDLAVRRVTTNVSSANVGQRLVFRSVARNLGPDAVPDGDSFDVRTSTPSTSRCRRSIASSSGRGRSCRRIHRRASSARFPPARKVIVKVVATVRTPTEGTAASLRFFTFAENGSTNDPNPSNNCMTASVSITGG